uniref:Uncharacterized protein n=1 Tax=Anguilla anguilla TaxID=7936 RepID=A0A0E9UAE8_ANGAN
MGIRFYFVSCICNCELNDCLMYTQL